MNPSTLDKKNKDSIEDDDILDNEDEIVIEDTPPEEEVVLEKEPPVKSADEGIADLGKQLEEARKLEKEQRDEAARFKREADEAKQEAGRAIEQANQRVKDSADQLGATQLDAISNAIDAATQEAESAEREYAAAMESANYAEGAKAQRKMAKAEAKKLQLEDGKYALEQEIERVKNAPPERQQPKQQQRSNDPLEAVASNLPPKSAAWLRSHPECAIPNSRENNRLTAAHFNAMAEGHAPETEGYFTYLDTQMGFAEDQDDESAPKPKKKASMSAPPSREPPNNSGKSPTKVHLSAAEKEMAEQFNPDVPPHKAHLLYARSKIEAAKLPNYSS